MTEQAQFSCDPTEFAGKRALVTGGTKGMGEAIVRRLAAAGARVATTARSSLPEGQTVKVFIQADVSTPEGVGKVAREVRDRLGGLDILVNNVGGSSAPSGGVLALGEQLLPRQHQRSRGGLLAVLMTDFGASWQLKLSTILVPAAIYLFMAFSMSYPQTERVQSNVSTA